MVKNVEIFILNHGQSSTQALSIISEITILKKYQEKESKKLIRDYLIGVNGWDMMTSVQLKRKKKNQKIEKLYEYSATREAIL